MKTIAQIADNELVQNNGEYARKKLCIHNNPYYAFIGTREDVERLDYTAEQIDAAAEVSDWDTVSVEACCG